QLRRLESRTIMIQHLQLVSISRHCPALEIRRRIEHLGSHLRSEALEDLGTKSPQIGVPVLQSEAADDDRVSGGQRVFEQGNERVLLDSALGVVELRDQ